MNTRWEYLTLRLSTDVGFFSGTQFDTEKLAEELNARGEEGWDLVSIFDIEKLKGGSKYVFAVLKRPRA
jgi:hypothetical protein